jgi:hypothetical protein
LRRIVWIRLFILINCHMRPFVIYSWFPFAHLVYTLAGNLNLNQYFLLVQPVQMDLYSRLAEVVASRTPYWGPNLDRLWAVMSLGHRHRVHHLCQLDPPKWKCQGKYISLQFENYRLAENKTKINSIILISSCVHCVFG